ncbi:MAG: helix-turn-helix transcriptional regulator [Bacteroidaceae bacterium]|nr:helix-turn-helix transcriptional regulator [Bacteroidaceae bacterium]
MEGGLEERGIKQTWLAERLGKSFCIVNSYVCNRRQPSLEVLFEIAKILNVDPKELIDSKKRCLHYRNWNNICLKQPGF